MIDFSSPATLALAAVCLYIAFVIVLMLIITAPDR